VGIHIAVRAGAPLFDVVAPDEGGIWIDKPILIVNRVKVPDGPDLALVNKLLGQDNGRYAAVVERHHVTDASLTRRVEHLACLIRIHSDRLFAEDMA
jgi:hypothetical protein